MKLNIWIWIAVGLLIAVILYLLFGRKSMKEGLTTRTQLLKAYTDVLDKIDSLDMSGNTRLPESIRVIRLKEQFNTAYTKSDDIPQIAAFRRYVNDQTNSTLSDSMRIEPAFATALLALFDTALDAQADYMDRDQMRAGVTSDSDAIDAQAIKDALARVRSSDASRGFTLDEIGRYIDDRLADDRTERKSYRNYSDIDDLMSKFFEEKKTSSGSQSGSGSRSSSKSGSGSGSKYDFDYSYVAPAGSTVLVGGKGKDSASKSSDSKSDNKKSVAAYNSKESKEQGVAHDPSKPPATVATLPPGFENNYMLKSQVVPPVCPACPSACPNAGKPNPADFPPCPPCARCPDPAFECKKVPAYGSSRWNDGSLLSAGGAGPSFSASGAAAMGGNSREQALPRPVLADFSSFGM